MNVITKILATSTLSLMCVAPLFAAPKLNKEEAMKLPIKEIVERYYSKNVYVGISASYRDLDKIEGEILAREFSYVTPDNDFKQSYIHPVADQWRWDRGDGWAKYAKESGTLMRLHAPISPQSSKWVKEDDRTAEELSQMLDEYMIALCKRYNKSSNVVWLDVVNETIAKDNQKDSLGDVVRGGWFAAREGTDKWENPWTKMGYDAESELRVPLYIDRAFELSNKYAPKLKQIINQHGNFEEEVWNKTMRGLVKYLREDKGRRLDGLGWQAHIDAGWEKVEGNLERLGNFIDWCHANDLEFHITEMNVWIRGEKSAEAFAAQDATYRAVAEVLLSRYKSGVVGLSFWGIRDENVPNKDLAGCLWNDDGTIKNAYNVIKEVLIENITK